MAQGDERNAVTFFRSYYEAAKELPEKQRHVLYEAIIKYAFEGSTPELKGLAKSMFILIKPNLDKSLARAQAGSLGGRNKTQANGKQTPSKTEANASEDKDEDKDKDKEDVVVDAHARESSRQPPPRLPDFSQPDYANGPVRPTVDEVRDYCAQMGYTFDPQKFIDWYDAKGWIFSGQPIQDWRAVARLWAQRDAEKQADELQEQQRQESARADPPALRQIRERQRRELEQMEAEQAEEVQCSAEQ